MKKLFEQKPLFHYTFVLAMVSIACGIVIGGVHAITNPIIEANLLQAKVESFEQVLKGIDDFEDVKVSDDYPSSVQSIAKGFNADNEVLGYIYEVYGKNSYGDMTIVISVGLEGNIIGAQFLAIEQTLNVPGTRTNLSYYVGSNVSDLQPSSDFISGATGSLSTVQGLLSDVASAHSLTVGEVIVDLLDVAYGDGYTLEVDSSFAATTHVTSKSNILQGSNVVGYMFSLTGSGAYQDGSIDSIVMEVYFDTNDQIVEIKLPEDSYNHTAGGFKNKNIAYLEEFIGLTKQDISATVNGDNEDITAGASNTRALIDELLEAFLSEVA